MINFVLSLYKSLKMSKKDTKENPMRNIRVEKLIINCSVGEPGDKVNKAAKVLKVGEG